MPLGARPRLAVPGGRTAWWSARTPPPRGGRRATREATTMTTTTTTRRADSLSYVRGAGGFADDASEASEAASEVSEAASDAAADDDQVSAQSASGRRSLPEKPLGAKYTSAAAARAWRLADARATARARERHAVATAPALEWLAFLERELERVSSQARGVGFCRRALEESDADAATPRARRAAETSRRTRLLSRFGTQNRRVTRHARVRERRRRGVSARRDDRGAEVRDDRTRLGETLVALEDEQPKETMKADFSPRTRRG